MVPIKPGLYGLAGLLLVGMGFFAGRLSAAPPLAQATSTVSPPIFSAAQSLKVQFDGIPAPTPDFGLPQQQTPQAAPDPREMIPLQPGPGQQPGNQPGQQGNSDQCPVFIYQDGKLYALPRPGQQPGQGQGPGPGIPGDGSPELIPMQPLPGTPIPGDPTNPFTPNRPKADSRS
jgi:hypothetical protein